MLQFFGKKLRTKDEFPLVFVFQKDGIHTTNFCFCLLSSVKESSSEVSFPSLTKSPSKCPNRLEFALCEKADCRQSLYPHAANP